MSTVLLPITLASAGTAAIINVWLALRIGSARAAAGVSIGDGGNPRLTARMRAHANFAEYTPFFLILLGVIEYNVGSPLWLSLVSAAFLLARVAHPLGMDGLAHARKAGALVTLATLLGLGVYAAAFPFLAASPPVPRIEIAPSKG